MPLHDESILDSIKTLLNIETDDTSFDTEIMIHINSSFGTLFQLGVGPIEPFAIESKDEKWAAFIGDKTEINSVKTFVYYEVRLAFDPPTTSYAIQAFERQRDELGWRLKTAETPPVIDTIVILDPLEV